MYDEEKKERADKSKTRGKGNKKNAKRQTKRNNRSSAFNRNSSEGRGKEQGTVSIYTGSSDNDPSWYIPTAQLAKDVASFPTILRSGRPFNLGTGALINTPGVMALYTIPSFGTLEANQSEALNAASSAFFNSLRRATSGTSYYEANDSMLYLLSVGSLMSYYAFLVRIYGVMNYYSVANSYTPEALITAMGVDFKDISKNMANFRAGINQLAYQMQVLVAPTVIDYITRHIFLYESIYQDSTNGKAQYYLYSPVGFLQYSEGTSSSAAGKLHFYTFQEFTETTGDNNNFFPPFGTADGLTAQQLITYGYSLLNPILGSESMNFIMADVAKAFGTENNYRVSPIAETYLNPPVHNPEVLMQMENAFLYGYNSVGLDITQSVSVNDSHLSIDFRGATSPQPYTTGVSADTLSMIIGSFPSMNDSNIPLNFHFNNPTPENILVATRLAGAGSKTVSHAEWIPNSYDENATPLNTALQPLTCGSEIVAKAYVYYYSTASGYVSKSPVSIPIQTKMNYTTTTGSGGAMTIPESVANNFITIGQLFSTFDWHPRLDFLCGTHGNGIVIGPQPAWNPSDTRIMVPGVWDLDNYGEVSLSELIRLNDVAILGQFTNKMDLFKG